MKAYDVGVYSRKLVITKHNPKTECYGFHVIIDGDDLFYLSICDIAATCTTAKYNNIK